MPTGNAGVPGTVAGSCGERSAHCDTDTRLVFEHLQQLAAGCQDAPWNGEGGLASLAKADIDEIRQLHSPPHVVRRTLEATWLLLNADQVRLQPRLAPPPWSRVQRMLVDSDVFLQRLQAFDAANLSCGATGERGQSAVPCFVAREYFLAAATVSCSSPSARAAAFPAMPITPAPPAVSLARSRSLPAILAPGSAHAPPPSISLFRQGSASPSFGATASFGLRRHALPPPREPLTPQRVQRASRAAAALFAWSAKVVVAALEPDCKEPSATNKDDGCGPGGLPAVAGAAAPASPNTGGGDACPALGGWVRLVGAAMERGPSTRSLQGACAQHSLTSDEACREAQHSSGSEARRSAGRRRSADVAACNPKADAPDDDWPFLLIPRPQELQVPLVPPRAVRR